MSIIITEVAGKKKGYTESGKPVDTATLPLKGADFGSGKGWSTKLTKPTPPPKPLPLEDFKEKVRAVCSKALGTPPAVYAESARGIYTEALVSYGVSALGTVNLITMEAYLRRETPNVQAEKVSAMLDAFTVSEAVTEEGDIFRTLYRGAAGEAIVEDYLKKVADFLAGRIEEPVWDKIPQERITNELTKPNQYLPLITEDALSGLASIFYNNLTLTAKDKSILQGLTPSTFQLLDFLLLKAHTVGNFSAVTFSTADYMKERGLKDRKAAKAQLEKGLNDLFNVELTYSTSTLSKKDRKKLPKNFPLDVKFRIIDAIGIHKGKRDIAVSFGKVFSPYIASVAPMAYHRSLLQINTRANPNAHAFGRKILEVYNMNYCRHSEEIVAGKNEVRLAVETLLSVSSLPSEADVLNLNRNFLQRIIKPFEKDLDALSKMGRWEYCRERGETLQPEDDTSQYEVFKRLYIRFTLHNPPVQERRLVAYEQKKQEQKKRRADRVKGGKESHKDGSETGGSAS